MISAEMEVIAPEKQKHGKAMLDLIAKVFSGYSNYFHWRNVWRNRIYHGQYDWETSRVGIINGEIITHWGVWGYDMRIGTGRVRVGGIGVVATHADYRKKGLMAKTARASIDAMRRSGYDMTILFGIDDYYDRFGYVRAWSDCVYSVMIKDLPKEKPDVKLQKFALRHRDDLDEIYNRENSEFTGTAVRPTYTRDKYLVKCKGYLWRNNRGKTVGYIVTGVMDEKLYFYDYGGDVEQVLRVLGILGRRGGYKKVKFFGLAYDSALCRRLRLGNCCAEIQYSRCGGAMIHMLNLESTLRKVCNTLSRRLKKSHFDKWRGGLLISNTREKALLKIENSKVSISKLKSTKHSIRGGEEIVQLIIGTDEPDEIIEAGKIRLAGDAKKLIPALFPNQHPNLASWDRY